MWAVGVSAVFGGVAAIRVPLWISGPRLQALMCGTSSHRQPTQHASYAIRASHFTLRVLSHLPLTPWRNTCLYRSVAECLVLRKYGVGCRLQLGVKRDSAQHDSLTAHAWVLRDGQTTVDTSHATLHPSS